jgi:colanic acid biosynthesis glycosyl transferase WcaI
MNVQDRRPGTVLVISQVYVPDPSSVGQHMHDAAAALAARGSRVVVLTARNGYEDPSRTYPAREIVDGVEVRRLPFASFGKSSFASRLVGGILFLLQAIALSMFVRGVTTVLVSTSPPFAPFAGVFVSWLRRARIKYWVMDLNPDQLVALGIVGPTSLPARVMNWMNRLILARAKDVVVLDRFMATRVNEKLPVGHKLHVIPPWPHDDHLESIPHAQNPFRAEHGLGGKTVVMYSGNHGPSNPFDTVLAAAERVLDDPELVLMFVGGGISKSQVDACTSANVRSLPYQPLPRLKYSLSAADVHLVTMGNDLVGVIHPCKVYGAMAVGRPILLVGPPSCHVADIIKSYECGWHVPQGDVDAAVAALREIRRTDSAQLAAMGERASAAVRETFAKDLLCGHFCEIVESEAPRLPERAAVHGWAGQAEAR